MDLILHTLVDFARVVAGAGGALVRRIGAVVARWVAGAVAGVVCGCVVGGVVVGVVVGAVGGSVVVGATLGVVDPTVGVSADVPDAPVPHPARMIAATPATTAPDIRLHLIPAR